VKRTIAGLVVGLVAAMGVATGGVGSPAQAATAKLVLMPMGDSITDGYQSTTGNGYRGPLWNELTGEGYSLDFVGTSRAGTMSDPDNEGHDGWRIDQIAAIADASLAKYKPDVVTLMLGTNDLGQNYQVSTAPARLSALVDQIGRDVPNAAILVANLIVSTNTVVAPARPAYNAAVATMVQSKQAAGKHVRLVDTGAITTADLFDALHPNDGGYQKLADAFNSGVLAAADAGWIPKGTGGAASATGAVRSGVAGKCLDLNAGNTDNGQKIQLWSCNGSTAQTWTTYPDGTLKTSGKCLDVYAMGTANSTKVELWDCNGGSNQVWQSYNGGYRNPASGRCLDDPAASTADGTQLALWDCNGTVAQKWSTPGA
jgi:lysophospholipase L1-like esterase